MDWRYCIAHAHAHAHSMLTLDLFPHHASAKLKAVFLGTESSSESPIYLLDCVWGGAKGKPNEVGPLGRGATRISEPAAFLRAENEFSPHFGGILHHAAESERAVSALAFFFCCCCLKCTVEFTEDVGCSQSLHLHGKKTQKNTHTVPPLWPPPRPPPIFLRCCYQKRSLLSWCSQLC